MWADAQRDGRPAEYRWRPLRKFVIPFLVPCCGGEQCVAHGGVEVCWPQLPCYAAVASTNLSFAGTYPEFGNRILLGPGGRNPRRV